MWRGIVSYIKPFSYSNYNNIVSSEASISKTIIWLKSWKKVKKWGLSAEMSDVWSL